MAKSILDQVLSSKKISAISSFDPEDTAKKLFSILGEREQDILIRRYGLIGQPKVTLEEIGKKYSITRERVRQIENASLKRIRDDFSKNVLNDLELLVREILDDYASIMSENHLIDVLLQPEHKTVSATAHIRFLLNQILHDRFQPVRESSEVYKAWATANASWDLFHETIHHLVDIITSHGEPMPLDVLLDRAKDQVPFDEILHSRYDTIVVNFLDVTKKIEENIFREWGLSHWNSIRPRRMNDKIYLVLKKESKPLHFTDIAKRINEAGFDNRTAYPATIHNELILDDQYVLVGRGIYALTEWGYKPGVVLDVIKDILANSQKPMSRDEIIQEVLKHRLVKRSTVILALMNKKYFKKNEHNNYTLVAR